jgi:pimeloyl-ACP methyl ester carboxylesterase
VPYGHPDLSVMKGWGIAQDARHTEIALLIARWIRAISGQDVGPINLLGFSYGGFLAYAVANEDTQQPGILKNVKGIISVDGTALKAAPGSAAQTSACNALSAIKANLAKGVYVTDSSSSMKSGRAALDFPQALSEASGAEIAPYFPAFPAYTFTNFQIIPVNNIRSRFLGGEYAVSPAAVSLFYTNPDRFVSLAANTPPYVPYQWQYDSNASRCDNPTDPVTFDDHLGNITVPILSISRQEANAYVTTRTGSIDVTKVIVNDTLDPKLYGHADFFMADNAAEFVWRPILNWMVARSENVNNYEDTGDVKLRLNVELRPNVAAYVEATYMANPDRPSGGKTLLALPGMGLRANSYRPLVKELFALEDANHSKVFSRAVLVDYPGHGGSSLPENISSADPLLFGDMTLKDYAATLLGAMDQLKLLQISPDTFLGHCMAATVIAMAQNQLIAQGTNLRRQYGVESVLLFAPAMPGQNASWRVGVSNIDLTSWTVSNDSTMGTYIQFPARFLLDNYFKDLSGMPAPGAPAGHIAAQILAASESLAVVRQVYGKPPFSNRPVVDPGIFGSRHGTSLAVIAFSQDTLCTPGGQLDIYKYLTGDFSGGLFSGEQYFLVDSADAVRAMHHSNPMSLLRNLLLQPAYSPLRY